MSRRKYVGVDSHALLSSLPGGAIDQLNLSRFWRYGATFPWRSHAAWFLTQMARWALIDDSSYEAWSEMQVKDAWVTMFRMTMKRTS